MCRDRSATGNADRELRFGEEDFRPAPGGYQPRLKRAGFPFLGGRRDDASVWRDRAKDPEGQETTGPSGAKARSLLAPGGTTEAVPFPKPFYVACTTCCSVCSFSRTEVSGRHIVALEPLLAALEPLGSST